MFPFMILFFALCYSSFTQNTDEYDDLFFLNFDNEIDSVIPATEETISCDCQREHTEWDKLFIMLENSQMKENMLLESLDEILKVELQTLRAEMLQFVENFAGTCTTYLEKTTTQIWSQMDQMITKSRASGGRSGMLHEIKQEKILQEILQLNQNLSNRLSQLERAWQWRTEEGDQRSPTSEEGRVDYIMHGSNFMVKSLWQELQETKAELKESQKKTTKPSLPAGCETVILFPMRSKKIFVSVHPTDEMALFSFTACTWVKVTEALDKTIVFSYGTKNNPYEIQLYLNYDSVVLAIKNNFNKISAPKVISSGEWTHICSAWGSANGTISLSINGKVVVTSSEISEDHIIPDGGILQIGQEKNGCCVGGGFNESLAFSGKITGFNIWDRILSDEEIKRQTEEDACNNRGNIVGWGVTEILPHGGAQYVFSP
ncbi:pentraxin-related protein PTX3 [Thamnophis elegans]|uniref:pentraxin-related protein PTX3 n=1 Tax=Thamnophis elegans TaxID=35005 RepID=UPI0013789363|nr:pentraxin-related protein PTX3 [Thamnophis elegans]